MIGKKIKKERQENIWFFEKLNIMCSDTSKNVFDKFMIGRNSESKKMNKNKKHNTNRKKYPKCININDHKIIPCLLLRLFECRLFGEALMS